MKRIHLIVATDEQNGIGKSNDLPWRISKDMQFFKETTTQTKDPDKQNAVIMGRNTWESIPSKFRPLPGRQNIVLSRSNSLDLPAGVLHSTSLEEAIHTANSLESVEAIFIIGGGLVYTESITKQLPDKIHITEVKGTHGCDTFFPELPTNYSEVSKSLPHQEGEYNFQFKTFKKQNHQTNK